MDKLYSPNEVAEILGYSSETIRKFIREGRIKTETTNKGADGKHPRHKITKESIEDFKKTL